MWQRPKSGNAADTSLQVLPYVFGQYGQMVLFIQVKAAGYSYFVLKTKVSVQQKEVWTSLVFPGHHSTLLPRLFLDTIFHWSSTGISRGFGNKTTGNFQFNSWSYAILLSHSDHMVSIFRTNLSSAREPENSLFKFHSTIVELIAFSSPFHLYE